MCSTNGYGQRAPVARVVIWGAVPVWLVTRYTEAKLLKNPRLSQAHERLQALFPDGTAGAHTFAINATMLMTGPAGSHQAASMRA